MEKFVEVKREINEVAADPDLEAVLLYTRATGYEGLEFVLLSEHWDETRVHTLNDGIVLIRVWDPPEPPTPRPFLCAYDGWLPVEDTGVDALRAALRSLQDFADFLDINTVSRFGVALSIANALQWHGTATLARKTLQGSAIACLVSKTFRLLSGQRF
jgi:hypothetical protein